MAVVRYTKPVDFSKYSIKEASYMINSYIEESFGDLQVECLLVENRSLRESGVGYFTEDGNIVSNVIEKLKTILTNVMNSISAMFDKVVSFIRSLLDKLNKSRIKQLDDKFKRYITDIEDAEKIKKYITKGLISNVMFGGFKDMYDYTITLRNITSVFFKNIIRALSSKDLFKDASDSKRNDSIKTLKTVARTSSDLCKKTCSYIICDSKILYNVCKKIESECKKNNKDSIGESVDWLAVF